MAMPCFRLAARMRHRQTVLSPPPPAKRITRSSSQDCTRPSQPSARCTTHVTSLMGTRCLSDDAAMPRCTDRSSPPTGRRSSMTSVLTTMPMASLSRPPWSWPVLLEAREGRAGSSLPSLACTSHRRTMSPGMRARSTHWSTRKGSRESPDAEPPCGCQYTWPSSLSGVTQHTQPSCLSTRELERTMSPCITCCASAAVARLGALDSPIEAPSHLWQQAGQGPSGRQVGLQAATIA
mmetsp:Transcript_97656/g.315297  ORF Transcript_97656/g.315297 Transcript_97656/m.315297 type:complete len:236 (+) Transcript_97656:647-1354(+)